MLCQERLPSTLDKKRVSPGPKHVEGRLAQYDTWVSLGRNVSAQAWPPQLRPRGIGDTIGRDAGRGAAWLARLLWEQEVASSNLAAPTLVELMGPL